MIERTLTWEKNITMIRKNRGEISPVELHCCGTYNPIKVDIYTTHHLGHGGCVHGSGENDLGNLFASSFPHKDKKPLTHRRNYKYDSNQGVWTGPPEPSDVSEGEIPKLSVGNHGTD